MKEHPIIYSMPMVRAYMDDRKTMTRRVIKPQYKDWQGHQWYGKPNAYHLQFNDFTLETIKAKCPYGQVGDRLWLKENFWVEHDSEWNEYSGKLIDCGINIKEDSWAEVRYCATDIEPSEAFVPLLVYSKRPSIHMPRWAARLTQTITDIKVEKIHDITEEDAKSEGIIGVPTAFGLLYKPAFSRLWDSINAIPRPRLVKGKIAYYESYPWEDIQETRTYRGLAWYVHGNPWVFALSYPKYSEEPTRSN